MDLSQTNLPIGKTNSRYPLQFAPPPDPITLLEADQVPNCAASSYCFDVDDFTNDFKVHGLVSTE